MSVLAFDQPLGKLIRLPLKLLSPERVITIKSGELKGAKWIVGSSIHGCWLGTYEREKQRLFAQTLKPADVVYDIGANVGFYTLLAAKHAKAVYAFEPLPRNLKYLRHHLALNHVNNVCVMDAAVSDKTGVAYFTPNCHPSMGQLSNEGQMEVKTIALDSLDLPPPTVIKMDIEGGEYTALQGAQLTIGKHHPKIFLATHGAAIHTDCVKLLQTYNYNIHFIAPDEMIAT